MKNKIRLSHAVAHGSTHVQGLETGERSDGRWNSSIELIVVQGAVIEASKHTGETLE